MLTEQEICRAWVQLFRGSEVTRELVERAELLLDQIRPESPLRHRLDTELREIQRMHKIEA